MSSLTRRLVNLLGVNPNLANEQYGGLAFSLSARFLENQRELRRKFGPKPQLFQIAMTIPCHRVHGPSAPCSICGPWREYDNRPAYMWERICLASQTELWPLPRFYRPSHKQPDRKRDGLYAVPILREWLAFRAWYYRKRWAVVEWLLEMGVLEEPYEYCYFNELRIAWPQDWRENPS